VAAPLPNPPVHIARAVPEAVAPPTRTPPAERQVAPRPHSEPARKFASRTPPTSPTPAESQSTDVAASRPTATGPLIPPRPVAGMATNRAPSYPEIALRRGEQGRVTLRVSVSADGRPLEVDVAKTSGYPSLDSAALSAVRQWRFVPATQAGSAVAAVAEVPVRFRIDN
jgi:protein TonB